MTEEEMQMLSDELEKRQALFQARFQTLSEKSGNCRREANNLEEEIQALQAGEALRHSPMDVALIQPWWSIFSRWEQHRLCSSSLSFREESAEYMLTLARANEEDWEGDWDSEKAASGWHEGITVDPAVDLAWCQNANGGSFGGGESRHTKKWKAGP